MNSASSFKVVETESTYPEVQILEGISIINDAFPDEEFFLSFAGNKVKAYVNLLDLQRLREQVSKVENKLNLEPDNPFRKILESIGYIRSYGIRSGKRSFVDYNKERKVRDRRQKVKERGMYFYAVDNNFSRDNKDIPTDLLDKIVVGDSEL